MPLQNTLDGPLQFVLLGLVVAIVAYIRSVPMVELKAALLGERTATTKNWSARLQIACLAVTQILLAALAVILTGRIIYFGGAYDGFVLCSLFGLACLFLLLHLFTDLRQFFKSLFGKKLA